MKATKATANSVSKKPVNFCFVIGPHLTTSTGCTPASLFLHRELRTRLSLLKSSPGDKVIYTQGKEVEKDSKSIREFSVGQAVVARSYGSKELWLPGIVIQRQGPVSYLVQTERGSWKRHIDQLRGEFRDQLTTIH